MFDPNNPDKKFVRMVLHQAFARGGVRDIYGEAWCLREVDIKEACVIVKHMEDAGLVSESGEPDYHRMTEKGQDVLSGEDY